MNSCVCTGYRKVDTNELPTTIASSSSSSASLGADIKTNNTSSIIHPDQQIALATSTISPGIYNNNHPALLQKQLLNLESATTAAAAFYGSLTNTNNMANSVIVLSMNQSSSQNIIDITR